MEEKIQKRTEGQLPSSSGISLIQSIQKVENNNYGDDLYLSAYYNEPPASKKFVDEQIKRLVMAFPAIQPQTSAILYMEIKESGMGEKRLNAAITYVIRNFTYKTPSIGDVLSFDRKLRLYTYDEVCGKVVLEGVNMNQFFLVPESGKLWALKIDAKRLGLDFLVNEK